MSSSTFVGNPDVMVAGPPPPPPPPPPVPGQLPAMRINTAETATMKKPQMSSNDVYEPPAAIQNAMLTKDKKPFTYTPGMGGKLDLSQIRSPRMARRVAKNANDEGIEGPPKSALESKPSPAASTATNLFIQPQVAIPVFPTNIPPQPQVNRGSQPVSVNKMPSSAAEKQVEAPKNVIKIDTKIVPIAVTSSQSNTPESPNTPTQVTLAKAPTPWLQNKNKPQEELPEWAKRASVNKATAGTSETSSTSPTSPTSPVYIQVQPSRQSPPRRLLTKQKEQEQSTQQNQYQTSPQYQYQQKPQSPQQSPQQCQPPWQQRQNTDISVTPQRTNPQAQQHERVIPIRIEDRPSVFDVKRETGHHQFKQPPTLHHQQRWGQVSAQQPQHSESQMQNRPQNQDQSQTHVVVVSRPEQTVGTYIIPVVVEGNDKKTTNFGSNTAGKAQKNVQQRASVPVQQHETGPVQSRSFRVLQKITDTDTSNNVGAEQIRRMELSEDERMLMNKFKEQVDHETYLHQEEDPRYRGAAIPSRAFRFLQNMTDSNDSSVTCAAPRNAQSVTNKRQNRNSKSFEETQANLPPSEQQVPEPKKYMGSAIPSRSFRILQAMTAPENIATQENRQADYTRRTENNMPGNQQGVFLPPQTAPFWYPEGSWWGYYPVPYNALPADETANGANKHSFPPYAYPHGNVYVGYEPFCPLYDRNHAEQLARINNATRQENPSSCRYGYETLYPEQDHNSGIHQTQADANISNITLDSAFVRNDKHFAANNVISEPACTALPNEINHLDVQSNEAHNPRYQRSGIGDNDDVDESRVITAMNIIDEESGLAAPDRKACDNVVATNNHHHKETLEKTFGPHINVPNYTYMDTSDSSDSSDDSSDFDNERLSDPRRRGSGCTNDTTSNNTSSDSDSDSYVAYSTGTNPREKVEKESQIRAPVNSAENNNHVDVDTCSENSIRVTDTCERSMDDFNISENGSFDRDRRLECPDDFAATKECRDKHVEERRGKFDSTSKTNPRAAVNDAVSHQLSVIYEDTERPNSNNSCYDDRETKGETNETPIEATDDPPDDSDEVATMVSVSLPLRFKFFVSENNEDVATVIVGDSKIRAERSSSVEHGRSEDDKVDDVRVNFHVGNDTSVDFTIKRHVSPDNTCDIKNVENSTALSTIPHVNFTLRKDLTRGGETCEKNVEAESTTEHDKISCSEPLSNDSDDDHDLSKSTTPTRDILSKSESRNDIADDVDPENVDPKPETAASKCSLTQESIEAPEVLVVDTSSDGNQMIQNDAIALDKDDRCVDSEFGRTNEVKRLLSVQDSREDTDDEDDSGVTSDISRMISEADTDSECTSSKNLRKYQRTQTHSRLFRLLNDDSILPDNAKGETLSRKEYLSLPLKTNVFNYDDSYCSNYSSGLTSPEYSPIHEHSWRRFHDANVTNGNAASPLNIKNDQLEQASSHKDDSYFRTWKSASKSRGQHEHDAVPSLAFKILDSKIPSWAYKVNVLCPRIKSTKNIPQTLTTRSQTACTGKINDPPLVVSPIPPTSCANANTNC